MGLAKMRSHWPVETAGDIVAGGVGPQAAFGSGYAVRVEAGSDFVFGLSGSRFQDDAPHDLVVGFVRDEDVVKCFVALFLDLLELVAVGGAVSGVVAAQGYLALTAAGEFEVVGQAADGEEASEAGEQRVEGSHGAGKGFPAELVPSARDGDGDGVVCER